MALTLEDLDRRVTVLEKGAEGERAIERAVAEIVSESEQRVRAEMSDLRAEMKAESQRLAERVSRSERRMVDTLNDRFDQVMAALDRRESSSEGLTSPVEAKAGSRRSRGPNISGVVGSASRLSEASRGSGQPHRHRPFP